MDRSDPGFDAHIRAFHDAMIDCWEMITRRLNGQDVPTPPVPAAPNCGPVETPRPASFFLEIVTDLMDSERLAMSGSAKEATVTALRFWREVHGAIEPGNIDKRMVTEWLDLLAKRPARVAAS